MARRILPEQTFEEDYQMLGAPSTVTLIRMQSVMYLIKFPEVHSHGHGADYTKDLRLEHRVECPATSAWKYDTSFCGQFLDEQGTGNYRRYSTIANLKPCKTRSKAL